MLYQLLCLARPMGKGELTSMISRLGSVVYEKGGVITDVKSYGRQYLAYKIRGVHGKYDQSNIWELEFNVSPDALQQLNHELKINEDVLRYVVLRQDGMPKLPPARAMFHKDPQFGHLLRSAPLPGALPIPLAERPVATGPAAAAAGSRSSSAGA